MSAPTTVYEAVGGTAFFEDLVARFYAAVATDQVLRPMYPEADLAGAAHRLTMFLVQLWGGPATYAQERGHPRLRMRHAPFAIGPAERDRWLDHMRASLAATDAPPEARAEMLAYFETAAEAMRNRP